MKRFWANRLKGCFVFCYLCVALSCFPLQASADSGIALGVKLGTLGLGGDIGYSFNDFFRVRGNVNYFSIDFDWGDKDKNALSMDASIGGLTAGVLLDVHPFGGGFRLTGGLYRNGIELEMDESFQYGGKSYSSHSRIKFKKTAPYIGIGYGGSNDSGFSFTLDSGILFLGDVMADYSTDEPGKGAAGIARELEDLKDDAKKFLFWPVTMVGVTYRF